MNIVNDLSKISINFTKKFGTEFYSKISNLELFPEMYQVIKIINNVEIRKIIIEKYVLLYFILKDTIYIINIFFQKVNYINLIEI